MDVLTAQRDELHFISHQQHTESWSCSRAGIFHSAYSGFLWGFSGSIRGRVDGKEGLK